MWINIVNENRKELSVNLDFVNTVCIHDTEPKILFYQMDQWTVYWVFETIEECQKQFKDIKNLLQFNIQMD